MSKKQTIKKQTEPKKMGRPTIDVDDLRVKIVYEAPKGLTDEQLCVFLGISTSSFYELKANNSEFLDTLKFYKRISAIEVLGSFTKVANGFSYDEVTKELKKDKTTGEMKMVTTKTVTKQVVPSAAAGFNYLKNRMSEHFKEKIETAHSFEGVLENIQFVIKGKDKNE